MGVGNSMLNNYHFYDLKDFFPFCFKNTTFYSYVVVRLKVLQFRFLELNIIFYY